MPGRLTPAVLHSQTPSAHGRQCPVVAGPHKEGKGKHRSDQQVRREEGSGLSNRAYLQSMLYTRIRQYEESTPIARCPCWRGVVLGQSNCGVKDGGWGKTAHAFQPGMGQCHQPARIKEQKHVVKPTVIRGRSCTAAHLAAATAHCVQHLARSCANCPVSVLAFIMSSAAGSNTPVQYLATGYVQGCIVCRSSHKCDPGPAPPAELSIFSCTSASCRVFSVRLQAASDVCISQH